VSDSGNFPPSITSCAVAIFVEVPIAGEQVLLRQRILGDTLIRHHRSCFGGGYENRD
jgi:hypothetical protein